MWVAIAAIAFTSAARAEAGLQSAKAYAHPVLEFLAKSQNQHFAVKPVSRYAPAGSARQIRAISRNASIGAWMAILPVFFIGLFPLPLSLPLSFEALAGPLRPRSSPLHSSGLHRSPSDLRACAALIGSQIIRPRPFPPLQILGFNTG